MFLTQTKTCLNSWASLRFRNLSKILNCCSSSGNSKNAPFSCSAWFVKHQGTLYFLIIFFSYIPLSIIEYSFHLEKYLNFQHYNNFLIGIQDLCRIPRIYLNSKINFITSLRLLFYSESMCGSSPYIKYSKHS